MKGWMYILECVDGSYYTGSTNNLELRLAQHQLGMGANHTKKRLPVTLIYFEEFDSIDEAFSREKQVQGWSRKKKEALINGISDELKKLAECMNETHFKNNKDGGFDSAQPPLNNTLPERSRRQVDFFIKKLDESISLANKNGLSELTLEEINKEIIEVRNAKN